MNSGKARTSWVHAFFTYELEGENRVFCCKVPDSECDFKRVVTKGQGTGSLAHHLKSHHHIMREENDGLTVQGARTTQSIHGFLESGRKKALSEWYAAEVCCTGLSINQLARSKVVKAGLSSMGYKPCSSPTKIMDLVMENLKGVRNLLKVELGEETKNGTRFSAIMDEWTAINGKRYLNIVLISSKSMINLGLVKCTGSMTSEKLKDCLSERLEEYGLDLKDLVCISTDGASVMKKLGKMLSSELGVEQQLCLAHGAHLAISKVLYQRKENEDEGTSAFDLDLDEETPEDDRDGEGDEAGKGDEADNNEGDEADNDDLGSMDEAYFLEMVPTDEIYPDIENFHPVIGKARKIVKFFRYDLKDEVLQKMIMECQLEMGKLPKAIRLVLDCKTRWNSLITMLKKLCEDEVIEALRRLKVMWTDLPTFSRREVDELKSLLAALLPLEVFTLYVCKEHFSILKADRSMRQTIVELEALNTSISLNFKAELLKEYAKRRNRSLISVMLFLKNPLMYTMQGGAFGTDEIHDVRTTATALYARLNPQEGTGRQPDLVRLLEPEVVLEEPEEDNITKRMKMALQEVEAPCLSKKELIEVDMITAAKTGELSSRLQMLEMALDGIPASSVSSERVFSAAGNICTKLRNRLKPEKLDLICMGRSYYQRQRK